jgi:transposase-like protein
MQTVQTVQNQQVIVEAQITQTVHCPNCGSSAERHYLLSRQLTRTQCPACDYLMITCSLTARVIEAYAPGIALNR